MVSQSASSTFEAPAKPPPKTNLMRLEEAIRQIAENRQRLPPINTLSEQLDLPNKLTYHLLTTGAEGGLWEIIRPISGFIQIIGDGWQTLSYDEWRYNRKEYKRKCLRCRVGFSTLHRYRFMCDPCNSSI